MYLLKGIKCLGRIKVKEIKVLRQQLRSYPDNFFVYPQVQQPSVGDDKLQYGLLVCDIHGNQQGFIEIGDFGDVVIK